MPRIDGYPAAETLTGAEALPVVQGGATKTVTPTQILEFVQANLPATSTPTTGGGSDAGASGALPLTFDQDGTAGDTFSFDAE